MPGKIVIHPAYRDRPKYHSFILQDRNSMLTQLCFKQCRRKPVVVIAERCDNAEPCPELSQRCYDFTRPVNMGGKPLFAHEVTSDQDKVGCQSIKPGDNLHKARWRHVRASDMNIREQQNLERRLACWPSFNPYRGTADHRIACCVPISFADDQPAQRN